MNINYDFIKPFDFQNLFLLGSFSLHFFFHIHIKRNKYYIYVFVIKIYRCRKYLLTFYQAYMLILKFFFFIMFFIFLVSLYSSVGFLKQELCKSHIKLVWNTFNCGYLSPQLPHSNLSNPGSKAENILQLFFDIWTVTFFQNTEVINSAMFGQGKKSYF